MVSDQTIKLIFLLGFFHLHQCFVHYKANKLKCSTQEGWMDFDGCCYFFSKEAVTHEEARAHCEFGEKGVLVEPTDDVLNTYLKDEGEADKDQNRFWVGFDDIVKQGTFVLESSQYILKKKVFHKWDPTTVQDTTRNCVVIQKDGEWSRTKCDQKRRYICKERNCDRESILSDDNKPALDTNTDDNDDTDFQPPEGSEPPNPPGKPPGKPAGKPPGKPAKKPKKKKPKKAKKKAKH